MSNEPVLSESSELLSYAFFSGEFFFVFVDQMV